MLFNSFSLFPSANKQAQTFIYFNFKSNEKIHPKNPNVYTIYHNSR